MRYEDFVLQFSSSGSDRSVVEVPLAKQGQASRVFDPPFSAREVETLDRLMAWPVRQARTSDNNRDIQLESRGQEIELTSQSAGARLFRALLPPEGIQPIYEAELALAREKRSNLRLKLKIDLSRPELLPIYNLPWELLYNPDTHDFLGLSDQTPIVRYLDVRRPDSTIKRPRKLRILIVMAAPEDSGALDLEGEADDLEKVLSSHSSIKVDVLRHATRESLYGKLRQHSYHILHFMGHGTLRGGEGCIVLETSERRSEPIRGATLAQVLRQLDDLQLVVLNACRTADAASSDGQPSPFEGVATALVLGGIPAVVGMRYPISDAAALEFSKLFYRELATGKPIEAALAAARLAIFQLDEESFEWAKPILFLRSQKGEIWPSGVWSLIKNLVRIGLVLFALALVWFLWSQQPIRNYVRLNSTLSDCHPRQRCRWR